MITNGKGASPRNYTVNKEMINDVNFLVGYDLIMKQFENLP